MVNQYNILRTAFSMIPHSSVKFRKFISKSVNDFGVTVQNFTAEEEVEAIVEPGIISSFGGSRIELKDYKELGLDWSKRYVTAWLPYRGLENAADRDGADQIIYLGKTFSVLQVENWGEYNGWQRCYCVEIKA